MILLSKHTNICDVKNANWEREDTIVLIFQIQMIQTYLKKDSVFSQQASERRKASQRNNLGQLGTHFSYYLYLLTINFRGSPKNNSPEPLLNSLHKTESLTSATARSPNFRSAPWRKSFPGSSFSVFADWRYDDVYQVIKNMSTPEIFTCHSTVTSYQFSFYKEERCNHGLYMTII